jgi:hypothetical protein
VRRRQGKASWKMRRKTSSVTGAMRARLVVISVKGGHLKATDVRDMGRVRERENAVIGVLISLDRPSKQMRTEVTTAGFYESPDEGTRHPRLQLVTVEDLFATVYHDIVLVRRHVRRQAHRAQASLSVLASGATPCFSPAGTRRALHCRASDASDVRNSAKMS